MDDELKGSQDARVASLWSSLDTHHEGRLDAKGLKDGLQKIDHRASICESRLHKT